MTLATVTNGPTPVQVVAGLLILALAVCIFYSPRV